MSARFVLTIYRLVGIVLTILGIIGYFTVADELRHFGEFLGVSCVLVSGIIFLLIDLRLSLFQKIAIQWVPICLLASIPFGAIVIDSIPLGCCIGLILGLFLSVFFKRAGMNKAIHQSPDQEIKSESSI